MDFSKLSLEKRARLLPPPTADQMVELKEYQKRIGYDESKMQSMKFDVFISNNADEITKNLNDNKFMKTVYEKIPIVKV